MSGKYVLLPARNLFGSNSLSSVDYDLNIFKVSKTWIDASGDFEDSIEVFSFYNQDLTELNNEFSEKIII